jgi:signal transduction histidine kinase
VDDNGIGVPKEYSRQIFQIFQRLHARSKFPGEGMGLALCHRIVEQHGGSIWVEESPLGGASFQFTIPVVDPTAASEPSLAAKPPVRQGAMA